LAFVNTSAHDKSEIQCWQRHPRKICGVTLLRAQKYGQASQSNWSSCSSNRTLNVVRKLYLKGQIPAHTIFGFDTNPRPRGLRAEGTASAEKPVTVGLHPMAKDHPAT
jgi:hypothetical protein